MQKTILYEYLGTNGTVRTPVHLENVYSVKKLYLKADKGKLLTNGKLYQTIVIIPAEEEANWTEIEDKGQN